MCWDEILAFWVSSEDDADVGVGVEVEGEGTGQVWMRFNTNRGPGIVGGIWDFGFLRDALPWSAGLKSN